MDKYRYKVYYQFDGRTKADPFRVEKDSDQIADALSRVELELDVMLDDDDAKLSVAPIGPNEVALTVETTATEETFHRVFKKCLNGLDLYATRLK